MTSLTPALQWRYATKAFDPAKSITDAELADLLESLRLAPSSYGMQPWKFLVITDPAVRQQLKEAAWNQSQVTDASHLLVLCAKTSLNEGDVSRYIEHIASTRGVSTEALHGFKNMMMGSISRQTHEQIAVWNQKQVYIALGMLLSACALKQIDSCPMEGFDAQKFDEILHLAQEGLTATLVCPIGYRAASDTPQTKVRFSPEEVIERR